MPDGFEAQAHFVDANNTCRSWPIRIHMLSASLFECRTWVIL